MNQLCANVNQCALWNIGGRLLSCVAFEPRTKLIFSIKSRCRAVTQVKTFTSGSAPAALSACGSQGIASHSTPVFCSPWLCVWGCSPSAPPSSPTPPSAGRSAGRSSVPVCTQRAKCHVLYQEE